MDIKNKVMAKDRLYLALIIIIGFILRLIPSMNFKLSGKDAYIHHDLVLRIVNEGLNTLSSDPLSLMGIKSYGYPPLFHIISSSAYKIWPNEIIFYIMPAIFGVLATLMFYKLSQELFDDSASVLISTFLFTVTPSILTRTSVFIPESMGIFLFISICYFIVKYIKTIPGYDELSAFKLNNYLNIFKGNPRYLIYGALILCVYIFTHRSWIFLALVVLIALIIFLLPSFRDKPILISAILGLVLIGIYLFITVVGRFQQEAVTILGFPKWIGVVTLILGLYGSVLFLRSKNAVCRLMAAWAIIFMLIGTYSFRFRDPYSAIPLTVMCAYVLTKKLVPYIMEMDLLQKYKLFGTRIRKYWKHAIIICLLMIPLVQGAFINYTSINQPSDSQMEVFNWINDNAPADAIIMSYKDDSYLLIGNTHRKDVSLWKTVYQGFLGEAPDKKETKQVQSDVELLFATEENNEIYFLLNKYNVSYIYMGPELYNEASNGLITESAIDTHYTTAIATGDATLYQYYRNPRILSPGTLNYQSSNKEYNKTIDFIEDFWNGYSYSDIGKKSYGKAEQLFEFETSYKGDYSLNAQIARLYRHMSDKSDNLSRRSDYIISWLDYKQMVDGSFLYSFPPEEYTLETMDTIYGLGDINSSASQKIRNRGLGFIKQQSGDDHINVTANSTGDSEMDYSTLKTYSQIGGMLPENDERIMDIVLQEQKGNGSFTGESYQDIEILKGISIYYTKTHDSNIASHICDGANWLKAQQSDDGKFVDDGVNEDYGINHYADLALIYYMANDTEGLNKTLEYIWKQDIRQDINPLKSYLTLIDDLTIIYKDEDAALELANTNLE